MSHSIRNSAFSRRSRDSSASASVTVCRALLVRDAGGTLYRAGAQEVCGDCHLWLDRVRAHVGPTIEATTRELRFEDQELRADVETAGAEMARQQAAVRLLVFQELAESPTGEVRGSRPRVVSPSIHIHRRKAFPGSSRQEVYIGAHEGAALRPLPAPDERGGQL